MANKNKKYKRSIEDAGRISDENYYNNKITYNTTSGGGYIQPINIERFKDYIKNKIYNYLTGGLPIDTVRRRLYNNLFQGYDSGISNLYDNIKRVRNAIVNNEEEYKNSDKSYRQRFMDDLFAEYLQIPKNERRNIIKNYLTDSPYKPSINKNNVNYKRINHRYASGHSGLHPDDEERLINAVMKGEYKNSSDKYDTNTGMPSSSISHGPVPLNKTAISKVLIDYGLGVHTISRGKDNKGEYVSYYDLWDMAPTKNSGGNNDESMGIGKPINIYDRVYLDDFYGVPNEYRGGYYIPEVIVKGSRKKHKDGGSIHIVPSKRGTFTAAATKHGMGVQEFAAKVLRNKNSYSSAMIKKANFTRNASKWNK